MASKHDSNTRWLAKLARETARQRMRIARATLKQARAAKRTASRRARDACSTARSSTREWIARARADVRQRIAELRLELVRAIAERRDRVRECCGADRAKVRARHDERIAAQREALEQLKRDMALENIWKHGPKLSPAQTRRERSQHAESELEGELSPDELIVYRRVRSKLKAKPGARWSRLEQFRHWMQEHSADVQEILARDAEQELQRAIAAEGKERRELASLHKAIKRREPAKLRAYVADALADVPF